MEENISQNQPVETSIEPGISRESLVRKPWLKIALFSVLGVVLVGGLIGDEKLKLPKVSYLEYLEDVRSNK